MICVSFNEGNDYNLHEVLFKKANEEFEEIVLFESGVYPQKLSFLGYYPYLKEEVRILVKKNSIINGKFVFYNKPKSECGYLEIYENNNMIYKQAIYPFYPIQWHIFGLVLSF